MISQEKLIEKINSLPRRRLMEVEDFVDFLASRSGSTTDLTDEEMDARIAQYAAEFGGTEFDLDEDLQEAGLEAIAERKEDMN